jgi:hypothetical protein
MGSGRSGAGGGGGGGGTTFRLPGILSGNPRIRKLVSKAKITSEVERVLGHLSKDYLALQFGSAIAERVYEQLFNLNVNIFQNKSWNGVQEKYGIAGGAGCLHNWADAIIEQAGVEEPDSKIRDTVRDTLEGFLLQALEYDDDLYYSGTSDQIIRKLSQKVFSNTSAYFLGIMIWRMMERQGEALRPDVQSQLQDNAQDKADSIVRWFDNNFHNKFYGEKLITHQDLFLIIQENMPSFIKELKK